MFSIDHLGSGKNPVTGGQLIRVKFVLQRIVGEVKVEEDIDKLSLSYLPYLYHSSCLGFEFFSAMIVKDKDAFIFHPSVYFHPNVRVDGFEEFRELYETVKGLWETEKEAYDRKTRKGKGKEKEGEDKEKIMFGKDFPGFPDNPSFWVEGEVGSSICLWPPLLFHAWARDVKNGKHLFLHPAPANQPRPSTIRDQSLSPLNSVTPSPVPSRNPSPLSNPLSPPLSHISEPSEASPGVASNQSANSFGWKDADYDDVVLE